MSILSVVRARRGFGGLARPCDCLAFHRVCVSCEREFKRFATHSWLIRLIHDLIIRKLMIRILSA